MTIASLLFSVALAADYAAVELEGFVHARQRTDFCGEACAQMALSRLGHPVDQDDVFGLSGVDPNLGRGAWTRELNTALVALGFDVGEVWHRVRASHSDEDLEKQWKMLHSDLLDGVPSIICMHAGPGLQSSEHFRLITGYDPDADEVLFLEPAEDDASVHRMKRETLLALWPLKYDARNWTAVRLRLAPGEIQLPDKPSGPSNADLAQRVIQLRGELGPEFTIVVEKPWVVVGDESAAEVQSRAQGTVRWATEQFKQLYFQDDPNQIYNVFLFDGASSYERNALELFGHTVDTPYGYASEEHHALVMDIKTGGGTLIHEMVHPFLAANFPQVQPWFNEGLASLYEQSGTRGGNIVGLTNWRLAGLQRAIRVDDLVPFSTLMSQTPREFYGDRAGIHYAQARYLCYYLQQQGVLVEYYHRYRANSGSDPTGFKTLMEVLDVDDAAVFQAEWQTWAMTLQYP